MANDNQQLVLSKPKELQDYLDKSKSAIAMALPSHLNADRMCRLALTCFSTQPQLRNCTAKSILGSIVVAAQLGLEPGIAGQGYLVPYKDTCTFIPGWQGLVGLLNNTGRATAWTGCVYEGDEWEFELGSSPKCRHRPGPNFGDVSKLVWAYACGKVNGSEQPVVEAWPIARVWKHRDKFNKVGSKHYSFNNQEMYARKVVLLQVLKYLPRSISLNNAIAAADAAEMGRTTRVEFGASRDENTIVDIDVETEEKFTPKTAKKDQEQQTQTGDSADGQSSGGEQQTQQPDPAAEEAAEIEENRRLAEEKAKADAAAKNKPPVAPKAPVWNADDKGTDMASLKAKLKAADLTEAQLVRFLDKRLNGMLKDCLTLDQVEGFSPKSLANALMNFDAIKAEVAQMPGKSAV